MKKILCLTLALLMTASVALVACNKDDGFGDNNGDDDFGDVVITTTTASGNGSNTTAEVPQVFTDCDEQVYVKNCLMLNFRKDPSENSKSVASVKFGDEKTYHRIGTSASWSKLQLDDGTIVYAKSKYLTTSNGFVCFDDLDKTIYAYNPGENGTVGQVRLRNFTDTEADGSERTAVDHGTALKVTGISKDQQWYRIEYTSTQNGQPVTETLYVVNGRYVTDTNPATTSTTVVTTTAA